jgi:hypothetical protein
MFRGIVRKEVRLAVIDLYSKRQKKLRGQMPDVYTYDKIPRPLKVQIVHIWTEVLGLPGKFTVEVNKAYDLIIKLLRKEYGVFQLTKNTAYRPDPFDELSEFFLDSANTEQALDVIEMTFKAVDRLTRDFNYMLRADFDRAADDALEELNLRLKEHGVGYQFSDNEIVRVDSELIHSEVVKPALRLLNQKQYSGAQQEFLKAHEHYRSGNTKEAMNEFLKAFESVMKSICQKRRWSHSTSATAKDLIQICLDHELIPSFWQNQFAAVRTLLESSVPTGRNKLSGHGQGSTPKDVPDHLAAYMLHMTASAIVFLAEAEAALR